MELDELLQVEHPFATFHDALLQKINIDYISKEAKLDFLICIGDPDSPDKEAREAHGAGQLIFNELIFCVIDPPDPKYLSLSKRRDGLWVDEGSLYLSKELWKTNLPTSLPDGALAHYFFVNDWNSFIYIAAMGVSFDWF
jgi:hypothetical protein